MDEIVLYHNPRCSKSRGAKALLEEKGVAFVERRYLEDPLSREELADLHVRLGRSPHEWVRKGEDAYREAGLDASVAEERVLDALRAGTCGVAIVSSDAANEPGVDVTVPATRYADVATLGVARHARNPDGAAALAEWLISEVKEMQIEGDRIASQGSVGLVALHYEDAVKLAERARYP